MSFFSGNKLLFGAVGIALSSVAVGYVIGRQYKKIFSHNKWKTRNDVVKQYLLEHGMREPTPLRKLREVRFYKFCKPNKTYIEEKGMIERYTHFLQYKFMQILWLNFILGLNFISLCFRLIIMR